MAKPLRHTKSGTKEVQRLLCHHINRALQVLQGSQLLSDEAVHSARKRLKKGRADLRLLRKALGSQRYTHENTTLRDVSRPLTAVRDARALMETLDALVEHSDAQAQALDLGQVRLVLQEDYHKVRQRVLEDEQTLETLKTSLWAAQMRAQHWSLRRRGWSVLGAGVQRVYRRGREAFAVAQDDPLQEHLHEWRKQVKYLWHQLQVLQPIQCAQIEILIDRAHTLANYLGDDHDLAILSQKFVETPDRFPEHTTMQTLAALIARRRVLLQEQAMTLGHRLYAEQPDVFVRRLREYWRAWRGKASKAILVMSHAASGTQEHL